jgi:hypothetical protein
VALAADAVLRAGLRPSDPFPPVDAALSNVVWDTLLSVEGGLPDDVLLGIPEGVILARDGVAAIRHIGAMVMTSSDQSIAVLSAWFNDPAPVTRPNAVSESLNEWQRAVEQLIAEGAAPTMVQQRISLQALFGRVPDIVRAFDALQAVSDVMDVDDMVRAVRRIGDRNSSLVAQKRAVAMMSAAGAEDDFDGAAAGSRGRRARAMVAGKRQKTGRCKFHDAGHCKFGDRCRVNHIGDAGNGHPPPPGHSAPPPYVAPAGAEAEETDEAVANLAGVLARLLQGMSATCNCSVSALVSVIAVRLQKMGQQKAGRRSEAISGQANTDDNKVAGASCMLVDNRAEMGNSESALVSVVCDTAATMPVAGADIIGALAQCDKTPVSVSLDTAHGTVRITEAVDVPNAKGLMDKSLVVSDCQRSLCPVVSVCETRNLGFEIDQGASGARFLSGEKTFLELEREGDFFVFEVPVDSGYESCDEGPESIFMSDTQGDESNKTGESEWQCLEGTTEHQTILRVAGDSTQSAFVSKFSLEQHCIDGHRPYCAQCPWCVAAGMRAKRANRVPRTDRVCDRGHAVSVVFLGPFEPDVDGFTQALIGVELESSKGFVGLQETRSAADTLESIRDFESELKSCSSDPSVGIVEFHHDDDKSFRSHVSEYARERGWIDTHTGGYNPNGNSLAERRIGMFNQLVRTYLLCATGGFKYYDQLWGRALVHASNVIDWTPFKDRISPLSKLAGCAVEPPEHRHSFGAYCLYRVPREKRKKFEPPARMGIWVGVSKRVKRGHLVVPIDWCAVEQRFRLGSTIEVITVKVYDNVFPLRMEPPDGEFGSQYFNDFVDSLMEPLFNKHPVSDVVADSEAVVSKSKQIVTNNSSDECAVEVIKKKRVKHGVVQYLVKWVGYNNRHNRWIDLDDMGCDDLLAEFECASALSAVVKVDPKDTLQTDAQVIEQSRKVFGPDDTFAKQAVQELMNRQSLSGTVSDYLPGYKKEIINILRRRMSLQDPTEARSVRAVHALGKLRMLLELKRDGRKKGRLIINREPVDWQVGSHASPVAYLESIRMLVYMAGGGVISINDVSVAFLQADAFSENDVRYVSYTAYKGSVEHILRLHGCLYGQKCASKQWYCTLATWLCDSGFTQAKNEPCLFVNAESVKVLLWVDDVLVRGSKEASDRFHDALEARFECGDGARQYCTYDHHVEYCGLKIRVSKSQSGDVYDIDQSDDVATFLLDFGLDSEPMKTTPMSSLDVLLSDSAVLGFNASAWCKSAIGVLHFLARGTRWDISLTVSMISQFNSTPTRGTEAAIRYLAGYLNATVSQCLSGVRCSGVDHIESYVDASHHGAKRMHSQSQTGLMIMLNGVPLRWRSTRQPDTADSPAVSEIYAVKEVVKDARLQHWVAEEFGCTVEWPFVLQSDSKQAESFSNESCAKSNVRGSFDWRLDWVNEVRNRKQVVLQHVCGELNHADIMTKCMKGPEFQRRRNAIASLGGQ